MSEKMTIEETINGLQSMIQSKKFIEHDFNGVVDEDVCERAIELLKEQEPRVLTLEEVLGGDECWFEYINGSSGYADVVIQDNTTALIYRTIVGTVPISDYGKKWRCWSYRPTEEQRKAAKWDA